MRAFLLLLVFQAAPLEEYRKADFGQKKGKVDDAWRRRVTLEFEVIRQAKSEPLRAALGDANRDVRAFAATALGILGDKPSVPKVESLVRGDSEPLVRGMALQALGWLKAGGETIRAAKSDESRDVQFLAGVAEGHLKDPADYAAKVREAFKAGLRPEELGIARVGAPAPDFAATESDGRPFKLSDVLRQQVVVLTFQLADW